MPSVPGARLVVIEPQFVFRGLKTVFARPAMSFDGNQGLDAGSGWAPGGEESHFTVSNVTADQQATRPHTRALVIVFSGIEISQFAISPKS